VLAPARDKIISGPTSVNLYQTLPVLDRFSTVFHHFFTFFGVFITQSPEKKAYPTGVKEPETWWVRVSLGWGAGGLLIGCEFRSSNTNALVAIAA
jgi:hypothetical protein